jgi:monoamine oxidase
MGALGLARSVPQRSAATKRCASALNTGVPPRAVRLAPLVTGAKGKEAGMAGRKAAVDRRTLLKGTAAAGAAVAVDAALAGPASADGKVPSALRKVDVAVVGAGLSGMSAARRLRRAGHSVVVLEARNRPGGRVINGSIGGGKIVELGAEFRGPGQDHLDALIKASGARTFPTFATGDPTVHFEGQILRVDALAEVAAVAVGLQAMADEVPVDSPQSAPHAAEWDAQTLGTWITENTSPGLARAFLLELGGFALGCNSTELSLLCFLSLVAAHGGVLKLGGIQGGNQQDRIVGGTQVLTDYLAKKLGDAIVLRAPVRVIDQTGGRVKVTTDAGAVQAGHVIVTVPPTLAGRIAYTPQLSALRDQFTQRAPMGYAIKSFAVYPTPFWRDAGLSGMWFSNVGPSSFGFDNTPPEGTPGVLLGFLESDQGRHWGAKPEGERRAAFAAQLGTLFGDQASRPASYVEMNWATQQWTRGCSSYFLPPGMLTEYGAVMRAPVGRIHWAGTETGTDHWGLMDAAISTGERAADEVLNA